MKLTKKHVGEKVGNTQWGEGESLIVRYIGQTVVVGKDETGEEATIDRSTVGNEHENAYFLWTSPKKEWFNFSQFGCHEANVRDLIKALDRRYKRR